jgi:hypothetical protein
VSSFGTASDCYRTVDTVLEINNTSHCTTVDLLQRCTGRVISVGATTGRNSTYAMAINHGLSEIVREFASIGAVQVTRIAALNCGTITWTQIRDIQGIWTLRLINTLKS